MISRTGTMVLGGWLAGCVGVLIEPTGDEVRDVDPTRPGAAGTTGGGAPFVPGQAAPPVFSCDSSAQPDELPLPRLSRAQLENTLRFAVRLALPTEESAIWTKASSQFARYPADQRTPAPGDLKRRVRPDRPIDSADQIDADVRDGNEHRSRAHREPGPPLGDDGGLRDGRLHR